MGVKSLFKPSYASYVGENPGRIVTGFCYNCQTEHSLPISEWLVVSHGLFTKLVCAASVANENKEVKSDD